MKSSKDHQKETGKAEVSSQNSELSHWSRREFLKGSLGSAGILALSGTVLFQFLQGCTAEESDTEFTRRASELINQMSIEEKISVVNFHFTFGFSNSWNA